MMHMPQPPSNVQQPRSNVQQHSNIQQPPLKKQKQVSVTWGNHTPSLPIKPWGEGTTRSNASIHTPTPLGQSTTIQQRHVGRQTLHSYKHLPVHLMQQRASGYCVIPKYGNNTSSLQLNKKMIMSYPPMHELNCYVKLNRKNTGVVCFYQGCEVYSCGYQNDNRLRIPICLLEDVFQYNNDFVRHCKGDCNDLQNIPWEMDNIFLNPMIFDGVTAEIKRFIPTTSGLKVYVMDPNPIRNEYYKDYNV